ncbi:MAG: hypothetical protein JGK17_20540 [Microcoleus sp. PH2017_10_PVI_O_A]|uniref:hypothetical protein n=1 Tax=unclassified Microcoleus TaxID=2642155 RepID=UPI001DF984FD|nr:MULTISPECIES: hypothetical protein [unclassified Microcoleus]TAE79849.1 MAG: hypothetical protein EAZ83_19990 [Oscillatoriales cyanobacterium]MCC3407933.1 hypothetical protein [Microcoleus sp. PH2017_10_PVI_O_A]MCC3462069.1 hypothetical protein [Microcoleus sp. PH2017_11_PCY_U_A]MCC3480537.1 hypothetical protein [Microcoleus sp. PH2017_12_PCY_D_A]MCC3530373.1 hypothetical protein [Microcoleus sp. PH2017_21_RUC_O_A]
MPKVVIVTGYEQGPADRLKAAIAQSYPLTEVEICAVSELNSGAIALSGAIVCPLTLDVPSNLVFPGQNLFRFCANVLAARDRVAQELQVPVGDGNFWLPVVLTAKGPLYAEAIAGESDKLSGELTYSQPLHLSDVWRQQLYELACRLLVDLLNAPPATYLMQFGFVGDRIFFDRLLPFPAAPAIASVGVQVPDLFVCHWHCLTNQPIYDLEITSLCL